MVELATVGKKVAIGVLFYTSISSANAGSFMDLAGATSQPIGHFEFCQRQPAKCATISNDISPIHLDRQTLATITLVNQSVNQRIKPVTDRELYGQEEYWNYPTDSGDCEDYVLLKQKLLHESGFALSSLLITIVRKPNGEGHAVLTVRTDKGDFILDNLRDDVMNWQESNYTFLKRQSSHNTGEWIAIGTREDVFVGAVHETRDPR